MSSRRLAILAIILVSCYAAVSCAGTAKVVAQRPSRAALIVQLAPVDSQSDDASVTTITRCISFNEPSISGLELLARSGLVVTTWGGAVCRIAGTGCDYPSEPCFCQCLRPPCSYWSYWYRREDRWMYSAIGSADHRVEDGSVEAWMWGDASTPPPVISFPEVCPPDAAADTGSSSSTDAGPGIGSPPLIQYALFLVMVLALLGAFWLTRGRAAE
jgi:hypothetical protein